MFGLAVELLTGRYFATASDDREAGEWPPHPARLFSALVSTWAESPERDEAERAALEWLEAQGPPHITAGPASQRDVPTVFVPVNDTSVLPTYERQYESLLAMEAEVAEAAVTLDATDGAKARAKAEKAHGRAVARLEKERDKLRQYVERTAMVTEGAKGAAAVLPEQRGRQPRTFPSVTPESPTVWFSWPAVDPGDHGAVLDRLTGRVVRLGHSASLVACRVVQDAPQPDYWPDPAGDHVLRVAGPGQLRRLEQAFARHEGLSPRALPFEAVRYRFGPRPVHREPLRSALDGDWFVFERVSGPALPLVRAAEVAGALRGALMSHADQPAPEVLTGHGPRGEVTRRLHAAFVALPFVGRRHADGSLLGVALVLPRELEPEARRQALRAIGRWERQAAARGEALRLTFGAAGAWNVVRVVGPAAKRTLDPETWSRPARVWASVTPVALDRNPGRLEFSEGVPAAARAAHVARLEQAWARVAETIADACERAGLPRPREVAPSLDATMHGVRPADAFPGYPPDRPIRRRQVHAVLTFDEEIRGPVLLGAGRYRGLGLFRPMEDA